MKLITPLQVGLPNNLGNVTTRSTDLLNVFGKPTYKNDDEISWTVTIENYGKVYTYNIYFLFNGSVKLTMFDMDSVRMFGVVGCEKAVDRLLFDKYYIEKLGSLK